MNREPDAPAPRDVLYVEDHPTNVLLMQALFKLRPHLRLVVATHGREARALAVRLQPALLLLDLRLPDDHGVALLEDLRRLDSWGAIPAVAVTAEEGFDPAGTSFCEVWPKPIDLAFVAGRLDELVAPARREALLSAEA